MATMTRREYVQGLLGVAASFCLPQEAVSGQEAAIPAQGVGRRIRHLSYCDIGGRPDSVQIMVNRRHIYVGHMFSNGVTILDAADPRRLKPVGFFAGGDFTRTHHLQVADDLLLLANGANIVAMQSYDNMRGYFENALADSITNRKKFRSGLSIHDISRPTEMKEIAFLEMQGFGINRLWWPGGRYAFVAAHFDGFTDHILCIVDLKDITKPEIVSRWWLPGMNRAAGEKPLLPQGRRAALHHMITAGDRGYAAWRDGGLTIHDISDPARPTLLSHVNWSPPFPGGTHTALPLPGRGLVVVADEANAEQCAKGTFHTFVVDVRAPQNPVPISTLAHSEGEGLLRSGHIRSAQPAREPAGQPSQRANHLRDVQQCRGAGVRHQGRIRAEGNRLLGAACSEAVDRSTAERGAGCEVSRYLRHHRRTHVRQ